jgi:FkbM family methyltransferase
MRERMMPVYLPPPSCQIPRLDEIYHQVFGTRAYGTFVEVGAHDGESFSNTCFLADLGWHGLYIEPVPTFATLCALRHARNNVKVIPCAVGAAHQQIDLHIGGTLTTTSARQVEVYGKIPWARGNHRGQVIEVPQLRLDSLLERMAAIPRDFDLLVIDTEGTEDEVLAGLSPAWRPRMMIVEIEDEHPDLSKFEDIRQRAAALRQTIAARGYREIYRDPINTVYVRSEI